MNPPKQCRCDGRYAGCEHGRTCERTGGGPWSPYFCAECDPRRVEHISRNLEEIRASLTNEAGE